MTDQTPIEPKTGHSPNPDFGNEPSIFAKDYSWQERSLELFKTKIDEHYSSTPGGFERAWVEQVTPSGGKTVGSIKKAAWLIDQDLIDFVVWVVPRNSIKNGFEDDARMVELANEAKHRRGERHLRIDTDFSASGRTFIPRHHHGAVITYQALDAAFDYLTLLSKHMRLAFVFDEIHHGAEESATNSGNQWGGTAKRCVELAHCVICLTGTPLRSDAQRVAFLEYRPVTVDTDRGSRTGFEVVPSFRFDYADGMSAGVARKLIFEHFDPVMEYAWEDSATGEVTETRRDRLSAIPKAVAQRLKRTPFEKNKGDLPEEMLRRAYEASEAMRRKDDPDAAVLVICRDERDDDGDTIEHAAQLISKVCGETAVRVSHDDGQSRERIREFKRSRDRWIVAKRMISEGTNLPRVRIIVLLSVPTQHVYWVQLIHRATRNQAEDRLQDALILQVQTDPLVQWAAEIEQEVTVAVEKLPEHADEGAGAEGDPEEILRGISAFLDGKETMLEGDDYTPYDMPARKIYERIPDTKLERWHLMKALRAGVETGEIDLKGDGRAPEAPFSIDERARRYWEEGVASIKQAIAIYKKHGRDENPGILVNACKRSAGMGTMKIEELLASHDDPVGVSRKFYEAARRCVAQARSAGTGELPFGGG